MVSLLCNDTKQFVEFKSTDVVVEIENGFATITLPFEVLADYHIQSNSDNSDGSITTGLIFKENNTYKIIHQEFSLKQDETIILNGAKHKVISNQFEVKVTLKLNENTSDIKLEGELYYQACTDGQCLFPRVLNFKIK
ncbi:MAG: hypothetical protein ABJN84_13760 [Flavobacteriaceae bacterium]